MMTEKETFDEFIDGNLSEYSKYLAVLRLIIDTSQKAATDFNKIIPQNDDSSFKEIINLHSFSSLVTISLLDLLVISKHLQHSKNDWEKVYFLKQSLLIIYETINTYNDHNKILNDYCVIKFSILKSDYLEIQNELKDFKKKFSYDTKIKGIRNNIAGHIEKDFLKYYDTLLILKDMNGLDTITYFINILKKFEELYRRLVFLLNELIDKESDYSGLSIEQVQKIALNELDDLRKKFGK
jgi:hypothetical protein